MISLREHPHVQGLLLGTALLATATIATPYAVSVVAGAGDAPDSPVIVTTDKADTADTADTTTTIDPVMPEPAPDAALADTAADAPSLASP